MVDLDKNIIDKIKTKTNKEIKEISQNANPQEMKLKSIEERMQYIESLLKAYQGASLVVTSRLHVALPCLALGTPVILLHPEIFEKDRLGTYLEYVNSYSIEEFLNMNIEDLINNPKANKNDYLGIRENLILSCENFINNFKDIPLDILKLPDLISYQEYVSKIYWYKDLYEILRKNTMKIWLESNSNIERLNSDYIILLNNFEKANNEIALLNLQIQEKQNEIALLNFQI